ncbi:hypothetical protein ACFX1X_030775 [Malus domestica]
MQLAALRKLRAALSESAKGTTSQHFFISENVFPTHPLKSLCISHSLGYPCKQPIQSKRHGEIALEYSSSTIDVLPKKLPHLPEEQLRQAKMIPAACGDNVQKKQAEKNAARTINPAQGVRAEELEKLPHLLGEQIRNCNIAKEKSFAVQFQSSSRSKLWKVNKINYLQNQICVLKLYSVWFLLCHICHVYLSFIICLFLV